MTDNIQVLLIEKDPISVSIIEKEPIQIVMISPGERGPRGDPLSVPPLGCFRIVNIYVSAGRKLVVNYDDQPA